MIATRKHSRGVINPFTSFFFVTEQKQLQLSTWKYQWWLEVTRSICKYTILLLTLDVTAPLMMMLRSDPFHFALPLGVAFTAPPSAHSRDIQLFRFVSASPGCPEFRAARMESQWNSSCTFLLCPQWAAQFFGSKHWNQQSTKLKNFTNWNDTF